MNKPFYTIVALCMCVLLSHLQAQDNKVRQQININREWKFILGDHSGAETVLYDDGRWDNINLPHSFQYTLFSDQ